MLSKPSHRRSPECNDLATSARNWTRERLEEESGFSFVELLVTILIIGILAAIAIPSFLGSETKAVDAQAKELAHTAATTAEAIAAENDDYERVTPEALHSSEPSIRIAASTREAWISTTTHGKTEYSVTAKAPNEDEFTIARSATGVVTRTCKSPAGKKDCAGSATSSW